MAGTVFTGKDLSDGDIHGLFVRSLQKFMKSLPSRKAIRGVETEDEYNFTHRYRGLAIVISNESFKDTQLEARTYTDEEIRKAKVIFSDLGYLVVMFKNLTNLQMLEVLSTVIIHDPLNHGMYYHGEVAFLRQMYISLNVTYLAADLDSFHNKADSFACVLASHGGEFINERVHEESGSIKYRQHVLFGSSGAICTKTLVDLFTDSNCPSLKGKPKLFFIQACRATSGADPNERLDKGVEIHIFNVPRKISRKRSRRSDRHEGVTERPQETSDIPQSDQEMTNDCIPEKAQINSDLSHITDVEEIENEDDRQTLKDILEDVLEGPKDWLKKKVKKILKPYNRKEEKIHHVTQLLSNSDTLIMYSTSSGKSGFGRIEEGGWMILSLYEIMASYERRGMLHEIDLARMLTEVTKKVAEKTTGTGSKSAATMEHRLARDVVFRPKYSSS